MAKNCKRVTVTQVKEGKEEQYSYSLYEDGRYTYRIFIEDAKNKRFIPEGKELGICHVQNYSTMIGPLNLEDLKALRKLIRKAIRNYESDEPIQI